MRQQVMPMRGGWILELDIRKFFDTMDHTHLRNMSRQRVRDGVLNRLIGKWLNAGVLEDGCVTYPDAGSHQGGVTSLLLANVYLHYVFDLWVQQWRQKHAPGDMIVVRLADDFIVGFQHQSEAERFREELRERFRKFNLELHPDKT